MVVLGVTGNIGCGKSTVSNIFKKFDAVIIDADDICHKYLDKKRTLIKNKLKILKPNFDIDSDMDRNKLSKLVFNNKKALDELCKILHPCIINDIHVKLNQINSINPQSIVVIDCPLLFEVNLEKVFDYIIVVTAPIDIRISRLVEKGFTKEEIVKREKYQLPLKHKVNRADFVIDNGNSLDITEKQVRKVWNELNEATTYGAKPR